MKLNCNRGDLVRYVGPAPRPNVFGWVGKVISYLPFDEEPAWVVSPPLPGGVLYRGKRYSTGEWVLDKNLHPIRDPGDDAVDEVIIRLGKPISDKETV